MALQVSLSIYLGHFPQVWGVADNTKEHCTKEQVSTAVYYDILFSFFVIESFHVVIMQLLYVLGMNWYHRYHYFMLSGKILLRQGISLV